MSAACSPGYWRSSIPTSAAVAGDIDIEALGGPTSSPSITTSAKGAFVDLSTADEIRRLPPVLTVEQAAGLLRIGRSKAYQAVKSGRSQVA